MPSADEKTRSRRRGPRPVSAESLERAATAYLNRLDSTAATLRRVLMQKVHRSAGVHGTDPEEGERIVNDLIARYEESGLVDDARFASALVGSLKERGASAKAMRHKLAARGVSIDDVDSVLDAEGVGSEDAELAAALELARRRRLGPHRASADRGLHLAKDFAAFARAGFSYEIARRVLDLDDGEE